MLSSQIDAVATGPDLEEAINGVYCGITTSVTRHSGQVMGHKLALFAVMRVTC